MYINGVGGGANSGIDSLNCKRQKTMEKEK